MAEPQAKRSLESQECSPSGRFEDQVVIITGGADGLGAAIVRRLACRENAKAVAIFDRAEEKAAALIEDLTGESGCSTEVMHVSYHSYYRI